MGETEHRQVRRDYVARDLNSSSRSHPPAFPLLYGLGV